ncbi:50S ribosomal protein L21e [Halorientalis marina]|jgi:large subunit ribosomal protein L21e|uniref:50S ribosomal protein L21e n=1 Tax=Halorientalis marina TaxID=2931976 RepID=UPI001FF698EB|nr:50S ribosomal protein L21e [Halorientalis marina]
MPNSHGPHKGTRHKLSNKPRERGTSPPQQSVAEYEPGQKVHLKIDPSINEGRFHPKFNGLTGTVAGPQGEAYKVEIDDQGKDKTVITLPAHLQSQE